jgi:hypothetical protein
MAEDDLTSAENAWLIVLMAEAREISNPELTKLYHVTLTGERRRKLNRLGFVVSEKRGSPYFHYLDEKGWVRVQESLDFDSASEARIFSAAAAAVHRNLRDRVLARTDYTSFGEMFARNHEDADPIPGAGDVVPEPVPAPDLEQRIRTGYASLVTAPGAWVILTRLRPLFPDVSKADFDEALRKLSREPDVNIAPESNQKILTAEDRAAAVRIGRQDKHLLAIGVR